jgi:uncharacterized membrane protein YqiK
LAEATRAEGDAQAAAILAVGQSEAEAMNKRAEAFAHYNEAAVLHMLKTSTGLDLEALVHGSVGRATGRAVTGDSNGVDAAR